MINKDYIAFALALGKERARLANEDQATGYDYAVFCIMEVLQADSEYFNPETFLDRIKREYSQIMLERVSI